MQQRLFQNHIKQPLFKKKILYIYVLEEKKWCADIHQSDKSIEPKFQLLSFIKHVLLFYITVSLLSCCCLLYDLRFLARFDKHIYIFILLNVLFYSIFHPKRQGMTKQNLYGGWYLCAIL